MAVGVEQFVCGVHAVMTPECVDFGLVDVAGPVDASGEQRAQGVVVATGGFGGNVADAPAVLADEEPRGHEATGLDGRKHTCQMGYGLPFALTSVLAREGDVPLCPTGFVVHDPAPPSAQQEAGVPGGRQ